MAKAMSLIASLVLAATTTLSSQATTRYNARKYFTDRSLESFIQRDHRIQVLIVN